jgi:hypothetical protein
MEGYIARSDPAISFGEKKQNTECSNCAIGTESSDFVLIWFGFFPSQLQTY